MSNELPATRTSLLKALEDDAREHRLISLGVFYERYRHGLASFLIRRYGVDAHDANEILHDFLCDKMTDASLIHSYLDCLRQSKSGHRSFRPYLVRSLSNFTIDRLRSKKSFVALDDSPAEDVLRSEYADLYTLEWVQDILVATFQRLRRHYLERDNDVHWTLFVTRWIEPLMTGKDPPHYEVLAAEYDFSSAKQVGNVLTNGLRMFKQKWKEVLVDDIGSDDPQALADLLGDARASLRMARYMDFSRLLTQTVQTGSRPSKPSEIECFSVDEQSYAGLLDLATDGFGELLPIEQSLLFESHLRTPIGAFLPIDSSCDAHRSVADRHLKDVLADPEPDVESVRALAKGLQKVVHHESLTIPASVAGVFRLTLIALAEVRCQRTITSVSTDELLVAMTGAAELSWVDGACRGLIREYIEKHETSSAF